MTEKAGSEPAYGAPPCTDYGFHATLPSMTREELFAAQTARISGLVPAHGFDQSLATFTPAIAAKVSALGTGYYAGKVRDRLDLGDRVLMYTSDRVSAFDR